MKSRTTARSGFTLVEALVAVAVLGVSLTPVFAQVNASFQLSRTIRENLTASMLAQEGIELVRGMRDDNWFNGRAFDTDLDNCSGGCRVQYQTGLGTCDYGSAPYCLMNSADVYLRTDDQGRYQYDSGTETQFQRTITITEIDPGTPGQLQVVSRIEWMSGTRPRNLEVTGFLLTGLIIDDANITKRVFTD